MANFALFTSSTHYLKRILSISYFNVNLGMAQKQHRPSLFKTELLRDHFTSEKLRMIPSYYISNHC